MGDIHILRARHDDLGSCTAQKLLRAQRNGECHILFTQT